MRKLINSIKYLFKGKAKKEQKKSEEKSENWDSFFTNVGAGQESKQLFKKLRVKLHPDRHVDDENKKQRAKELHNLLLEAEYDIIKLKALEEIVLKEFG